MLSGTFLAVTLASSPTAVAAPPLSPAITRLPFFGSGDVTGAGTGGAGTAAGNAEVSTRCNGGEPVLAPQWYGLGKAVTGQVHVRTAATWNPRYVTYEATGSAIVDHWTGEVLTCGSDPLPRTGRAVDVVGFYRRPPQTEALGGTWRADLQVYVGRTNGRPPANDHLADARRIATLPFTDTVDTAFADAASTGADAVALRYLDQGCLRGTLASELASVWYRYTPSVSGPAPEVTITPTTAWAAGNDEGTSLAYGFSELTANGPVVLGDPSGDCDTRDVLQAGRTYYLGVATYNDAWSEAVLVPGGPVRVHVTAG